MVAVDDCSMSGRLQNDLSLFYDLNQRSLTFVYVKSSTQYWLYTCLKVVFFYQQNALYKTAVGSSKSRPLFQVTRIKTS